MSYSDIVLAGGSTVSTITVTPPAGSTISPSGPASSITLNNGSSLVTAPSGSPISTSMVMQQSSIALLSGSPVTTVQSASVGPAGPPGPAASVTFLSIAKWGR